MIDFAKDTQEREQSLTSKEQILGATLYQPYANNNSGAREILSVTQLEHAMQLYSGEIAHTKTGYEERFGDYSSAVITADAPYEVVAKVSKFENVPNHHYFLILRNLETNELDMVERKCYSYSGETYGYLYNNSILDQLDVGYEVDRGDLLRTSASVDKYGNRKDGVNLRTMYKCSEITKEDGMRLSYSAREKLASPLFKKVELMYNDNDVFLNMMGKDGEIKSFPDIGEEIQNGILFVVRREQQQAALFDQSVENMSKPLLSDDKYTIENGVVIDIDVKCNSPEILGSKHMNSQLLYYYNNRIRFLREIVSAVDKIRELYDISKLSYDLETLYYNCKRELRGDQFADDNGNTVHVYSGTMVTFMVLEKNYPNIGDKLTNRFGGKGVIAEFVEDELMPRDMDGRIIELELNGCTCPNRTNGGQVNEISISHISLFLIDFFRTNVLSTAEVMQMIVTFLAYVSEEEAACLADYFNHLSPDDKDMYVQQVLDDGYIQISQRPLSEPMTQDRIAQIYKEFPFVHQRPMIVAMKNSDGTIRYVYSYRPVTVGEMYIYRLKQYAEEKFSVTNLSSTNIRGENSRNKQHKNYKALHPATPIQFGYMEADELGHLGVETVVEAMMVHSLSPQGRKLVGGIYTGDPYNVDVKLNSTAKNRSAEQVAVYLKALGSKILFTKIKKKMIAPFKRIPFKIMHPLYAPIKIVSPEEKLDVDEWIKFQYEQEKKKKEHPFTMSPYMIEDKSNNE